MSDNLESVALDTSLQIFQCTTEHRLEPIDGAPHGRGLFRGLQQAHELIAMAKHIKPVELIGLKALTFRHRSAIRRTKQSVPGFGGPRRQSFCQFLSLSDDAIKSFPVKR